MRYKNEAMNHRITRWRMLWVNFLMGASLATAQQPVPPSAIQIRVLEGDGAINSIRLHRGHDPVVEVLDANGKPAPGATVTFLLPALGAGGTFQDSGLSLTEETNARGTAAARGLRPNRIAGQFQIRVTASWRGQTASASLRETNAEPVANSGSSKKILIFAAIGGAAAAGIAVAAHGKSSGSNAGASGAGVSTGVTIVSGSPTLGPPH
jgi:hypothetical protein